MKIYDVSVPINEKTPVYEGDPNVEITTAHSIAKGDAANVSRLCFGVHTATHVDAPNHFIQGMRKVDALPLEILIGSARVVEIDENEMSISAEHIKNADLNGVERVLFKTRNSAFWNDLSQGFRKDFTYIEAKAARSLVDSGVKLVGIDYLSVEKFGAKDFTTHTTLLKNQVIIIEGLDLREVSGGTFELICLPLKIAGGTGDGAPARTVLRELN
ncbi:MAG: cyclase family protein [Acidobacteria bacterium]|nr:cyclase family protein [Acidobacteriota bacterium]MCA1637018.1 cyclase family protein [Acidobacteriota bacterium]